MGCYSTKAMMATPSTVPRRVLRSTASYTLGLQYYLSQLCNVTALLTHVYSIPSHL